MTDQPQRMTGINIKLSSVKQASFSVPGDVTEENVEQLARLLMKEVSRSAAVVDIELNVWRPGYPS